MHERFKVPDDISGVMIDKLMSSTVKFPRRTP